ncbi:MAG: ribonuclease Y [Chlamydiia bacterium]|nr:ribonuclease Y [Chlamydiia bacterium]
MPGTSILFLLTGLGAGFLLFWLGVTLKKGGVQELANEILKEAQRSAQEKLLKADLEIRERALQTQKDTEKLLQKEKSDLNEAFNKLQKKEESLQSLISGFQKKQDVLEKKEAQLNEKLSLVESQKLLWDEKIETLSNLTKDEAKVELLAALEKQAYALAEKSAQRILSDAKAQAEEKAKKILTTAIGRLSTQTALEITTTTVSLPNKEVKGKIIGREGRNIRHLEQLTGVTFILDDLYGEVVLSSFNPTRRHVAKVALLDLIAGGSIHPTRIEEAVEKAQKETDKLIFETGEKAAEKAGVLGLSPEIITLLGKLSFRVSFGQNVLEHSIEVSRLMGLMASELRVDKKLAERIGLLHDMGKALSQEVPGSHAIIGYNFALKHGESEKVANGIGCHHNEMEPLSIEAALCQAADTLSGARPGARLGQMENYIERIKNLEELAYEFPGVEKSYALQSGKEIRVVVFPDMVDDQGMQKLAKDLTQKIESQLDYPGKIKVTVIRERRAVEYAI